MFMFFFLNFRHVEVKFCANIQYKGWQVMEDAAVLGQTTQKLSERVQVEFIKQPRSWFIVATLTFSKGKAFSISEVDLKLQIIKSLKQLFGEAGGAIKVDVLKFNPATNRAILRCPSDSFIKVRSALVMVSEFSGSECFFKVHRVAANLLSLTASSRTFEF